VLRRFSRLRLNIGNVVDVAADRHPIFIKDRAPQDTSVIRPEWAEREEKLVQQRFAIGWNSPCRSRCRLILRMRMRRMK
jgi:hypothetical protein